MQVGIDSFTAWDDNGLPPSERLQSLIEQIEYAHQIKLGRMYPASLPHSKLMQATKLRGTRKAHALREVDENYVE